MCLLRLGPEPYDVGKEVYDVNHKKLFYEVTHKKFNSKTSPFFKSTLEDLTHL